MKNANKTDDYYLFNSNLISKWLVNKTMVVSPKKYANINFK